MDFEHRLNTASGKKFVDYRRQLLMKYVFLMSHRLEFREELKFFRNLNVNILNTVISTKVRILKEISK